MLLEGAFRPGGTEHEFADPDVLRALRRRSLARLRREVEPVPADAFARFLGSWHGIGSGATGHDRLLEVVGQLEGYPMPASILERDVLAARVRDYTPRLLDELGAAGEVVWIGRGPLGRDDGRVALYRRDRAELLASAGAFEAGERPESPLHDAIRQHLERRGASFFGGLRLAIPDARNDEELLDAVWDLVWSGEVTNDTFAALRALSLPRSRSRSSRPGRPAGMGPPRAAGRWSLTADLIGEGRSPTERGHATALALLERHGVVTREAVLAEGLAGGFASVYAILKPMEEAGRVRRGYFVDGLGAAQFAMPGAVDRLRAERELDETTGPQVVVPGRRRSGAAVRRHAAVAEGRGGRPATAAARGRRLRGAGWRRGGTLRGARWPWTADAAGRGGRCGDDGQGGPRAAAAAGADWAAQGAEPGARGPGAAGRVGAGP